MTANRRVVGSCSKTEFCVSVPEGTLEFRDVGFSFIEIEAADQIVTVDAGVTVAELQMALKKNGQCLPLPDPSEFGTLLGGIQGTVGGLIATNLPHGLSSQHGGPREWLLHAEVSFHEQPAASGAKVVKSVAGYDVHKIFIGSWGRLGPIQRVTLRTWPLKAVSTPTPKMERDWCGESVWIMKTLPTLFDAALGQAQGVFCHDRASCTLWAGVRPLNPEEGWIVGPKGEVWRDNADLDLESRIKSVFDPEGVWV